MKLVTKTGYKVRVSFILLSIGLLGFIGGIVFERFTLNHGAISGAEAIGPRQYLTSLSSGNGRGIWFSLSDYYQQRLIQEHGGDTFEAIAYEVSFYNDNAKNIQSMEIQYLGGDQEGTIGLYAYRTVTHTKDNRTIPFLWMFITDEKGLILESK